MLIYRFRITSEEHEEFLREITIQPAHTFLDFHHVLLDAAELIPCDQASFFLTDKKYKKTREISLKPVSKEVKRYDPEMDEMVTIIVQSRLMKETRIKDAIEDPHQRFIYEYHGKTYVEFMVELVKIMHTDAAFYPSCTRRVGELPVKKEMFTEVTEEAPAEKKIDLHLARLEAIEEDDAAIAEIEHNIEDILFGSVDKPRKPGKKASPSAKMEEETEQTDDHPEMAVEEEVDEETEEVMDFSHDSDDPLAGHQDDRMEHLEDFDDIEHLEIRYTRYSEEEDE